MPQTPSSDLHGAAPDHSAVALLILDILSDFEFEDGALAARRAWPVAQRIAALRNRARRARIPTIFVNDNLGRWRSDARALLKRCRAPGSRGRQIALLLCPGDADYIVLKAKHSGFFATPLEALLQYIGAKRLILAGTASQQCILLTACDAYVRDFGLIIPRDCTVSLDRQEQRFTGYFFKKVLKADTGKSRSLRLSALKARASSSRG